MTARAGQTFEDLALARESFAARVIAWQQAHGRHDLPWQLTPTPYTVWLSEVMLQQTQVATVIPYFERFIARFPDVRALARATLDEVLQLWSGLGYYSRARNLQRAAEIVVQRHGGRFPAEPQALAALPGVGRSTAAAIAALAYGRPAAILDGNAKRVLARVFGVGGDASVRANERELWALAEALLPASGARAYTQGLMDLGATICVRRAPHCQICPFHDDCIARRADSIHALPAIRSRSVRPERSVALLVLRHRARVLLEKRPAAGVWGGLWCFPEVAPDDDLIELCSRRYGATELRIEPLPQLKHDLTHFRMWIRPLQVEVGRLLERAAEPGAVWLAAAEARRAALPAPVRRLLGAR